MWGIFSNKTSCNLKILGITTLSSCMMNTVFFFIQVGAIGFIIFLIIREKKNRNKRISTTFNNVDLEQLPLDFTPTMKVVGYKSCFLFAMDDTKRKIYYSNNGNPLVFSYDNLISVQRLDKKAQIIKSTTIGTIGALLGDGVFHAIAAPKVDGFYSIDVKILLRNMPLPTIMIPCFSASIFLSGNKPVPSTQPVCAQGIRNADSIVDALSIVLDNINNRSKNETTSLSVTDELLKIASLKEKGLLSEDEFSKMKDKLLA